MGTVGVYIQVVMNLELKKKKDFKGLVVDVLPAPLVTSGAQLSPKDKHT